jgi:hypothetical protein
MQHRLTIHPRGEAGVTATLSSPVGAREEEVGTASPDQSADDGGTALPAGALEIDMDSAPDYSAVTSVSSKFSSIT